MPRGKSNSNSCVIFPDGCEPPCELRTSGRAVSALNH
ncbi:rCG30849 [Rattus norvegicus]|uniref:RCG30849 n=1 Tax=Rattus norvegicus TaxID=10116 RepID=A6IS51_RAT|nr:rCG30849 [Rattus norvegicus]